MITWRAVLLLVAAPAWAGPPMSRATIEVPATVPENGQIRVELRFNCTGVRPRGMPGSLRLARGETVVAGRWQSSPGPAEPGGSSLRYTFQPSTPLTPGVYSLTGAGAPRTITVVAADHTPPDFAGLASARCNDRAPMEGCESQGVFFDAVIADGDRPLMRLRRRGERYRPDDRWEGSWLHQDFKHLPKGDYIATLRALDGAGNEGGRVCEIPLQLPLTSCRAFAGKPLPASCASDGKSALDGVQVP